MWAANSYGPTSGAVNFFHFRFGAFFWKIVLYWTCYRLLTTLFAAFYQKMSINYLHEQNKTKRRKTKKSLQQHSSLDPANFSLYAAFKRLSNEID